MIEFGKKMKSMNAHSSSSSSSKPQELQKQESESTLDARQARRVTQYSGPMLSKDGTVSLSSTFPSRSVYFLAYGKW